MKKSLVVLGAAAMVAAAAVPALAFENEFHGMYRAYGYVTNGLYNGSTGLTLTAKANERTSSYVEQRARLQYIAKASDDLKLVTHFELDTLFGGASAAKYAGSSDAGVMDADGISLETKNVYLDFNIPSAPVNVKIGIQPYSDAYQGTLGNFDGSGVMATAKLGMVTPSLGWFRLNNEVLTTGGAATPIGKKSIDLLTAEVKAAVTKDVTVGASYYYLGRDTGTTAANAAYITGLPAGTLTGGAVAAMYPSAESFHTLGANVAAKVGPAALSAFGAYQFGDYGTTGTTKRKLSAYGLGALAKINVGVGNVNVSGLYLSGDKTPTGSGKFKGWQELTNSGATSYFGASNMWLLVRNNATINTSATIGGNRLSKGDRGLLGMFAGFDAAIGKAFVATNIGYAQVAESQTASEKKSLGTELNATVGYKLYDNLSVSLNGAYAILGNAMDKAVGSGGITGAVADAKDIYLTFARIDYAF